MTPQTDTSTATSPPDRELVASGLAQTFDVADAHTCHRWASRVLGLREHWTPRHPHYPFHTLGLAAYLDAVPRDRTSKAPSLYRSQGLRRHYNELLRAHFADLLDTGRQALASRLGLATCYDEARAALPGFHIHLPHPAFSHEVASIHRDLQFRDVFPELRPSAAQVFTFTLPLSLPPGAGIHFWVDGQRHFHAYELGRMLVHDGLVTHQAVLHPQALDLPRIMWQGHGIVDGQQLILYW